MNSRLLRSLVGGRSALYAAKTATTAIRPPMATMAISEKMKTGIPTASPRPTRPFFFGTEPSGESYTRRACRLSRLGCMCCALSRIAPVSAVSASHDLLEELTWRGLIADKSQGLEDRLAKGPISAYIGFDASARSLHVGHLLQVFMLTHLQRAGGTPFVIIGGGTGMVGDPSGKSSERQLLDDAQIQANSAAIRAQLAHFVDFLPGPNQAQMVDNREWLADWRLLDFLRDIGKYFNVPYMLSKDSVQARLAAGMSFTEFSYQTLQAADFLVLYRERGVEMQMGGGDQWGN